MQNLIIEVVPKLLPILTERARYKVAYGGRGSGKSQTFARAIIARCLAGVEKVVCAREIQKSIKESVHALLEQEIRALGLIDHFEILETEIRCRQTGSEIIFVGLRTNIESLKSLQGATIVWIEEGATVSKSTLEILMPTIRADGSEIWITFNPRLYSDPVWQRFVVDQSSDDIVINCNYSDNPWFPQILEAERLLCLQKTPDAYDHIWLGQFIGSDAELLIAPKVVQAASAMVMHKDLRKYGRRIIGIDPAHKGKDTTVLIHRKMRAMFDLTRWAGLDLMQQTHKIATIIKRAEDEDSDSPVVNIDYGMGVGIGERLRELGHACNIINFASKARDPEKYLNARAEMYGLMAEDMAESIDVEQGICDYRIPPDSALVQQLSAISIERDSSGRLKLAPKDQIKKTVGRSPDEADAAALTYSVPVNPYSKGAQQTTMLQAW